MDACRKRVGWLVVGVVILASCSSPGPDLTKADREQVVSSLRSIVERSSVSVNQEGLGCVVDGLSTEEALSVAGSDELGPETSEVLASGILDCVGLEPIVSAIVSSQIGEVSPAELECVTAEFDPDLAVTLVSSALEQSPISRPSVELALASGFAFCLTPQNLLDQG